MTNEAILRDKMSAPVNFNVTETAMEKGTLVVASGPRGVKASNADGDVFIGVLSREKIVGDGRLTVPVYVDGIFDMTFTGPVVPQGSQVSISGPNILKIFTAGDSEDGVAFGKLLEASTVAALEMNQVMIGRGS